MYIYGSDLEPLYPAVKVDDHYALIVEHRRFIELVDRHAPTGYHDVGLNSGSPRDGLLKQDIAGVEYLWDRTAMGDDWPVFADASTMSADQIERVAKRYLADQARQLVDRASILSCDPRVVGELVEHAGG